jgi:hypothetical protein
MFTDDDLKWMKERLTKDWTLFGPERQEMKMLLARLESSERLNQLAFSHIRFDDCSECGFALKAWRKAAGK